MLELTQDAADAIRDIVGAHEDTPAGAGLRISTETVELNGNLMFALVAEPQEGDETIERETVRVYLSPDASALLADKVLNAHAHDDHVHFVIEEQEAVEPS
jgi:iron-sulfur cluster assembly protein